MITVVVIYFYNDWNIVFSVGSRLTSNDASEIYPYADVLHPLECQFPEIKIQPNSQKSNVCLVD